MFAYRTLLRNLAPVMLAVLALAPASGVPVLRVQSPVTLFTGVFITLDAGRSRASAVAVADGRIVAVGDEADLQQRFRVATTVRLPGVTVPGFADAHIHTLGLGEQLEKLDLRGLQKDAIVELVAAQARTTAAGGWILGGGWDQGFWSPARFPQARDLDAVAPTHPVMLTRIDGHSVWLNSVALTRAGITAATPDPDGGRILRDPSGAPTGMLVDNAVDLVQKVVPSPTREQLERRMVAAFTQMARWGLTSVHDAGATVDEIAIYKDLLGRGQMPVRAYVMARGTGDTAREYLGRGPEIGLGDGRLTVRSFKVMLDGALGSRGAQLLEPYSDERGVRGLDLMPKAELHALVKNAAVRGFQVNAHAIGDAAVRRALDAFEANGGSAQELARRRFRVEHVSLVNDRDLPRFSTLGVIASMQPNFVGEYSRWAVDRVGEARITDVYRTMDLLRSGALVAAGSDFPAADTGDPIVTLFSMVTRMGARAAPQGGWHPDQKASVDQTLKAMTAAPAFAAFQENDLGAIAPGRYADFTVLSADPYDTPPERLNGLKVLRTIVGGTVIFQ